MDKLRSLLCLKINMEYRQYKEEQLKLNIEDVYANAYQIQSMMCIYELLLEMTEKMTEKELISLITSPRILDYLYAQWLKTEDSAEAELEQCLSYEINGIYKTLFNENGGIAA